MPKEAPFDVWDGEELGLSDEVEDAAAEEVAMHLDPESEVVVEAGPHWSELTDGEEPDATAPPVCYFADEHPEPLDLRTGNGSADEREVDLEELLERQHYSFPD